MQADLARMDALGIGCIRVSRIRPSPATAVAAAVSERPSQYNVIQKQRNSGLGASKMAELLLCAFRTCRLSWLASGLPRTGQEAMESDSFSTNC